MMLAASAISSASASACASVFSPLASTCRKRVSATHYRFDPYGLRVLAASFVSTPLSTKSMSPVVRSSSAMPSVTVSAAAPMSISAPSPISISAPAPLAPTKVVVAPAIVAAAPVTNTVAAATGLRYAVIRFKQETVTFIAPFRVQAGETVVVEGDRGENIGIVRDVTQEVPSFDVSSRIIRKATDKDMSTLRAQREREAAVLKQVQGLASTIGLHATIEDVEYQFDLNKLTIFVRRSAKGGFVDFRKLQRSLFREFRCRIWCSYMDEVEAVENGPRSR